MVADDAPYIEVVVEVVIALANHLRKPPVSSGFEAAELEGSGTSVNVDELDTLKETKFKSFEHLGVIR